MNNNNSDGGNVSTWILTIAFIVMKLCGVINWSWLWVLSPAWIRIVLEVIIAIIIELW